MTAGKCLNTTRTEVLVKLKPAPGVVFAEPGLPDGNHVRFTLSPQVRIASARARSGREKACSASRSSCRSWRTSRPTVSTPYERLIGDAMEGDPTLFARQDAVEAAWAIVDPVLEHAEPALRVRVRQRGPAEAKSLVGGGWA